MGTGASSGRDGPCVLHVLHRLDGDELGLGILDLARAIGRQGWRTVIACSGGSLAHEAQCRRRGGRDDAARASVGCSRGGGRSGRLAAAGKRHGVALVHAHEPSSIGLAAVGGRAARGRPRHHRPPEHAARARRSAAQEQARGESWRWATCVIAVSEHLAEQLRAMPGAERERLRTIPSGSRSR